MSIGEQGVVFNHDSYSLLARMSGLYNEMENHEKAREIAKKSLKIKKTMRQLLLN